MLYNEQQILKLHQHTLLIISSDQSFQQKIMANLGAEFSKSLDIQHCLVLPKLQEMAIDRHYICVLDLDHRLADTLHWLEAVESHGVLMPILTIGNGASAYQVQHSVFRAYSFIASAHLDIAIVHTAKLTNTLMSMIRDSINLLMFRHNEYQVKSALNNIDEAVVRVTHDLKIEYMNSSAEKLLSKSLDDLIGSELESGFDFFDEKLKQSAIPQIIRQMGSCEAFKLEGPYLLLGGKSTKTYVSIGFAPIKVNQDILVGYFVIIRDITIQENLTTKLSYHSSHDQLTGLLSRMEFESRLQQAINCVSEAKEEFPTQHVLLYIDLDQFKVINETCGHAVGDELIRQYSKELSRVVRKRDTLARLGGDEFGVILWNCSIEKGIEIANNLRRVTEDFRFVWIDRIHTLTVSIGSVPITHSIKSNAMSSWAEALRLVDGACQRAKENGRNRVEVTDVDDELLQERYGEMEWIARLVSAFEGHGLLLFCQQIYPVASNCGAIEPRKTHYEILVRYQEENGKLVPPGVFLPPAERYNLIGMLDRWVIRSTFAWLASHPQEMSDLGLCSINLSGASLCDEDMPEFIKICFKDSQIDPKKICFEITETVAVTNLAQANQFIGELRSIGCKFSLDDFGVGMSSFAYLKHMDVDFVKIDGSFVRNIVSDPIDEAMVRSINDIGHILGKKTVAEFCEDKPCYDLLQRLGVDYVQGYFIGKPTPIDEIDFKYFKS